MITKKKTINPKEITIQFFTVKPRPILSRNKTHKNLKHPKHLSPSFSLPYMNPPCVDHRSIANIPSKYRRMQRTLSLLTPSRLIERRARVNLIQENKSHVHVDSLHGSLVDSRCRDRWTTTFVNPCPRCPRDGRSAGSAQP